MKRTISGKKPAKPQVSDQNHHLTKEKKNTLRVFPPVDNT